MSDGEEKTPRQRRREAFDALIKSLIEKLEEWPQNITENDDDHLEFLKTLALVEVQSQLGEIRSTLRDIERRLAEVKDGPYVRSSGSDAYGKIPTNLIGRAAYFVDPFPTRETEHIDRRWGKVVYIRTKASRSYGTLVVLGLHYRDGRVQELVMDDVYVFDPTHCDPSAVPEHWPGPPPDNAG